MKPIRVLSVFGTRPEAIKMAPLVKELKAREEFESLVCLTAQHREMLDSVMRVFSLQADYDLNIMQSTQTLSDITTRVLKGLEEVYAAAKPDLVLVHGDTTTTFSAALAAFYAKIPVGHVEAGLRTFDRYSPFPEEMNRSMVARLATLHFAPTAGNAENLRREGVTDGVFVTGNTVIDAMRYTVHGDNSALPVLQGLDRSRRILTMTCHRRENYGEPMEAIFRAVRRIAADFEDVEILYPVHLSPIVRETAQRILGGQARIHLVEPLDAMEMHNLMSASYLVMTDSGGLQEEAPALGKPVVVMRRETERPEAVEAGTVVLAGVEEERVYSLVRELLTNPVTYEHMAHAVNPYGDGNACRRIADAICWNAGLSAQCPEDFRP